MHEHAIHQLLDRMIKTVSHDVAQLTRHGGVPCNSPCDLWCRRFVWFMLGLEETSLINQSRNGDDPYQAMTDKIEQLVLPERCADIHLR